VARDADSGRVQWRRALDVDRVVVADGVVWAGEDRRIHAIGLSTGRLLVTVWLASRLGYTQVMGVARGTVYAQSFHLDRLSPVVKVLRPA
jgi:outer membrane protein assembly factor BamB